MTLGKFSKKKIMLSRLTYVAYLHCQLADSPHIITLHTEIIINIKQYDTFFLYIWKIYIFSYHTFIYLMLILLHFITTTMLFEGTKVVCLCIQYVVRKIILLNTCLYFVCIFTYLFCFNLVYISTRRMQFLLFLLYAFPLQTFLI